MAFSIQATSLLRAPWIRVSTLAVVSGAGVLVVGILSGGTALLVFAAVLLLAGSGILLRSALRRPAVMPEPAASSGRIHLDTILAHLPSSFVFLDPERRVLTASGNFEAITGRSLHDMVGRHCTRNLWFKGFCQGCPSQEALDSGRTRSEVVPVTDPAGRTRYFEHVSVPVRREGRSEGVLEIVTDVTDRRLLQDHMVRAEKLASVGEMASVLAHEMRNALTSVKMILQLMQEDEVRDEESVAVALDSIAYSEGILQQLLDFARPAPPKPVPLDVAGLLAESARMLAARFDRLQAELVVEPPTDLPELHADPERLRSAIVNLLLNASQASEPGGRVVLRARGLRLPAELRDVRSTRTISVPPLEPVGVPEPDVESGDAYQEVHLPPGTQALAFEVEDGGPGIPPDRLDRVFDPFYTTKVNGTGLGLSLVKQVANDHGGVVVAENLDPGCRVTIVLPLSVPLGAQ